MQHAKPLSLHLISWETHTHTLRFCNTGCFIRLQSAAVTAKKNDENKRHRSGGFTNISIFLLLSRSASSLCSAWIVCLMTFIWLHFTRVYKLRLTSKYWIKLSNLFTKHSYFYLSHFLDVYYLILLEWVKFLCTLPTSGIKYQRTTARLL